MHCTLAQVCSDPKGESGEVEESSAEASQRLQRMKIQSRRTFKFRKTRKREKIGEECEAAGGGGGMEAPPAAKVKASSMTATVLRRARQGRKQKPTVQISIGKESTLVSNILIMFVSSRRRQHQLGPHLQHCWLQVNFLCFSFI